jgi:hypothetical protein
MLQRRCRGQPTLESAVIELLSLAAGLLDADKSQVGVPVARRANHLHSQFSCPPLTTKIFRFARTPNQPYKFPRLIPFTRGVSRSSRTLGWDAVDATVSGAQSAIAGDVIVSEASASDERH